MAHRVGLCLGRRRGGRGRGGGGDRGSGGGGGGGGHVEGGEPDTASVAAVVTVASGWLLCRAFSAEVSLRTQLVGADPEWCSRGCLALNIGQQRRRLPCSAGGCRLPARSVAAVRTIRTPSFFVVV